MNPINTANYERIKKVSTKDLKRSKSQKVEITNAIINHIAFTRRIAEIKTR